jgi:hypothetical protein
MAESLFEVGLGFADQNIYYLSGSGSPGTTQVTIDAPVGSSYKDTGGKAWMKFSIASGDVTDWKRIADEDYVGSVSGGGSWRSPADVHDSTNTTTGDIETDLDADDLIQGVAVYDGMRILASAISGGDGKNVYIVSGSSGSWTLTEDTNNESAGDTVYIIDGDDAGQTFTYDGTNWVDELEYIRTFIGKSGLGSETPTFTGGQGSGLASGTNLEQAIDTIDTYIGIAPTPETRTNNPIVAANDVNENIDSLDASIGSDSDIQDTHYISKSNTIYQNLSALSEDIVAQRQLSGVLAKTVIDSVSVDEVLVAKWILVIENVADPSEREIWEVIAAHDGTPTSDATGGGLDWAKYSKLNPNGGISGSQDPDVTLSGSGTSQTMNITVESGIIVNVYVSRIVVQSAYHYTQSSNASSVITT